MKKAKVILRTQANKARAIDMIARLPFEPAWEIEIKPHKSRRSLNQNALYWKWLGIIRLHIAESTGQWYSEEDLHDFYKRKFLPARTVEVAGEVQHIPRSTKELNTAEMAEYMNRIDQDAIERLHLWLPQPNQPDEPGL